MYSHEMHLSVRCTFAAAFLLVSVTDQSSGRAGANDGARAPGATNPVPDAAHAARAKRRWSFEGGSFDPSLIDSARRRIYLFDDKAHVPFAASTETGIRIWTAKPAASGDARPKTKTPDLDALYNDPRILDRLPPVERRQFSRRPQIGAENAVLRLARNVLLVHRESTLTAYDLDKGEQLWARPESCRLEEARGDFARLDCFSPRSGVVIAARSGKAVVTTKTSYDEDLMLGPNALLRFSSKGGALSSNALDRGGSSWSTTLSLAGRLDGRGARHFVITDAVVVFVADAVRALDARTGKLLWQAAERDCDVAAAAGDELRLLCHDHIQILGLAGGKPLDKILLPLPRDDGDRLALVGDREHLALIEAPDQVSSEERIFFRSRAAGSWTALRRPSLAVSFSWDRSLLIAAGRYDAFVFGLDPAAPDPALTALPPDKAIAAIIDDAGPSDRLIAQDLLAVDGLAGALTPRLDNPNGALYGEALAYLDSNPIPDALPALVRRLPKAQTSGERLAILNAISAQDSETATRVLVDWLKDAPSKSPFVGDPHGPLYQQVWRTGRTSGTGLCVAGTRAVLELGASAPDGKIGTAHPLLFQEVASDASWVGVCQARQDTNHDGSVSVMLGHHGDVLGDEMQPYLIVGSGAGLGVDEFLGSDPTGRYVAVRQGACLDLIDTRRRTATRLPDADLRDADPSFGRPRAVSFDADGTRMLYIKGGIRPRIIVRDLARATETSLDPGPGNLWHATLDPEGLWVMTESLSKNRWPVVATTLAGRTCRGPAASYSTYGRGRGFEPPVQRVISTTGGSPEEVSGLIRPFGRDLLVRGPDGALGVVSADGKRVRTIVPADCHARVVHADGKRGIVAVGCLRQERGSLELYGGPGVVVLGSERTTERVPLVDRWDYDRPRFAHLGDGSLIDLDQRALASKPSLGPNEARTTGWEERRAGVFAIRADGAELATTDSKTTAHGDVPKGPLQWRSGRPH
jgi:PQQ-like domain